MSLLGEVKNACVDPPGVSDTHWSDRIKAVVQYSEAKKRAEQEVPVTGVFRIWLEHPPGKDDGGDVRQCECDVVPLYPHSNPDHMVELHPVVRIGELDFSGHVHAIPKGYSKVNRVSRLGMIQKKRITIAREHEDGEPYIVIRGPKTGFNHWLLTAAVRSVPQAVPDGHLFRVNVVDGTKVVKANLPAFTVAGTAADRRVRDQGLAVGERVTLYGIVRLHLETILDRVTDVGAVGAAPGEVGQHSWPCR